MPAESPGLWMTPTRQQSGGRVHPASSLQMQRRSRMRPDLSRLLSGQALSAHRPGRLLLWRSSAPQPVPQDQTNAAQLKKWLTPLFWVGWEDDARSPRLWDDTDPERGRRILLLLCKCKEEAGCALTSPDCCRVRRCRPTGRGDFSFGGHRLPSLYRRTRLMPLS